MTSIRMELVPWPIGQSVGAYPRKSELKPDDMPPPGVPVAATAVVAADQSLTYTTLPDGEYWATAPLGGVWRYRSFHIETPDPTQGPQGPAGPQGPPGPAGPALYTRMFEYGFSNTVAAGPSNGTLRFDNANPANATKVWANNLSWDTTDVREFLRVIGAPVRLFVQDKDDGSLWVRFTGTAPPVFAAGYIEWAVAFHSVAPAGALFGNNQRLVAAWVGYLT